MIAISPVTEAKLLSECKIGELIYHRNAHGASPDRVGLVLAVGEKGQFNILYLDAPAIELRTVPKPDDKRRRPEPSAAI